MDTLNTTPMNPTTTTQLKVILFVMKLLLRLKTKLKVTQDFGISKNGIFLS